MHLGRWSNGRVVLPGDAGYGPAPPPGWARAWPHVTPGQELPPGAIGSDPPKSALTIRMATLSMRSMTRWPMRAVPGRQFAETGGIERPDYCCAG